jgi:hypothetical protein
VLVSINVESVVHMGEVSVDRNPADDASASLMFTGWEGMAETLKTAI